MVNNKRLNENKLTYTLQDETYDSDVLLGSWYDSRYFKPLREKYMSISTEDMSRMVDDIYDNPEDIDNIAKKYNVEFIIDYKNNGEDLICGGGYVPNDNAINFYITLSGVDAYRQGKKKGTFKTELLNIFVHETIHKQQNQEGSEKESYFSYNTCYNYYMNMLNDMLEKGEITAEEYVNEKERILWLAKKMYLRQTQEVDAYARSLAQDMIKNKITLSKLINNIPELKITSYSNKKREEYQNAFSDKLMRFGVTLQTVAILTSYYLIGGKTWKRFLRRVYEFLPSKLQEKEISYYEYF